MTVEKQASVLRVLAIGDVVGRPGRELLGTHLKSWRSEMSIDLVIANGENAAGGFGLDRKCAKELQRAGVDVITLGDHSFKRGDLQPQLESASEHILRPGNFPPEAPGQGWKNMGVE